MGGVAPNVLRAADRERSSRRGEHRLPGVVQPYQAEQDGDSNNSQQGYLGQSLDHTHIFRNPHH